MQYCYLIVISIVIADNWVYLGLTSITASELNVLVREQRALGGLEKQIPGSLHQIRSELMSNIPSEMQDCQAR